MLSVSDGFTFSNFLADALAIFLFVVWLWLLITVTNDLFRRHDISGWGKAAWVIALILFSYLAIFVYLITQGKSMAQRNAEQAKEARAELRQVRRLQRRRRDRQARRAQGVGLDQRRRIRPPARKAGAVGSLYALSRALPRLQGTQRSRRQTQNDPTTVPSAITTASAISAPTIATMNTSL